MKYRHVACRVKQIVFRMGSVGLIMLSLGFAAAGAIETDRDAAPPAKAVSSRSLQGATDLNGLLIVVPAEWKEAGTAIADDIRSKWKSEPRVKVANSLPTSDDWQGNVLLIGNLGNNGDIAKLYALRFTYADAVFPGDGGYQLQTLVDPFGKGGNTVILAASSEPGLKKGMARLKQIVEQQKQPQIPWLSEAVVSPQAAHAMIYGGTPSSSDLQKGAKSIDSQLAKLNPERSKFDALLDVFSQAARYGEYYQMTGDEAYGQLYRKLMLGYADFLNRNPEAAKDQLNDRKHMWTSGMSLFAGWTVNEPSPLFTGRDRERIVSALYLTLEANNRDGYLNKLPDLSARFNHDIFPALSLMYGSAYFQKYNRDAAADAWYAKGDRVFTGNTSNITLDEGSDYLMHVPTITLDYAIATGDQRFLKHGLRPSADLQALMIDNLGTMSGGGDVYPFGRSSAYTWGHSAVMNAASWFFNEPLYQFLLERTRTGPFNKQNMDDLKYPFHRYMTSKVNTSDIPAETYPLVQAYPVEQGVYDELERKGGSAPEVAQSETVHKLAFRQGLDQQDSYLLVDGFAAGTHNQHDANTIIKYSANGRIFIDDRDYIERGPEHHTGVIVVKDGVQEEKPPLSRLKWVGDANGIGISLTELPGDNGTDWDRMIVSPGGRFYIVYDEIRMKEDANYLLENVWQTLGTVAVKPDRFEVAQQGTVMTLHSLDDSELRTYGRRNHFLKYWETVYPYPYAGEENVLREVKEEQYYREGDTATFVNVLSSTVGSEPKLEAERLNGQTLRIRDNERQWLAHWGQLDFPALASDGVFYLAGDDELMIAGATRVRWGVQEQTFEQPVLFKLNLQDHEWKAFAITKGVTRYNEDGVPLTEGLVGAGSSNFTAADMQRLKESISAGAEPAPQKPGTVEAPAKNPAYPGWSRFYRMDEEITSSVAADLDGDGGDELLIAGAKGKVQAVDGSGRAIWTFESRGRVNEVTVQQLDGKPTVFIATENWMVIALDAEGKEKWRYKFPSDAEHRELKGNLLGVTRVRVAHVNGEDQEPWIMVGTQFRYVYGLDREGKLKYEDMAYYYGIEDMEFADFDGDGRDEGVLGTEYSSYVLWKNKKLANAGGGFGPGWKVVVALNEWSGDDHPAVALGTKEHRIHLVQYKNGKIAELWQRNIGGEVNDIRHGDFNGDGLTEILAGSGGFQFYALNPDGSVRWRRTLSDRVLKVNGLIRDGTTRYLAAADNGSLFVLDDGGSVNQSLRFGSSIIDFAVGNESTQAWVVLQDGSVYTSN
ncbi:MAG: hypothetical protein K0R75_879 [Paenibacillaceae bacterium]|nr:hypothetical protein [Paenibacillaceae bacterium]